MRKVLNRYAHRVASSGGWTCSICERQIDKDEHCLRLQVKKLNPKIKEVGFPDGIESTATVTVCLDCLKVLGVQTIIDALKESSGATDKAFGEKTRLLKAIVESGQVSFPLKPDQVLVDEFAKFGRPKGFPPPAFLRKWIDNIRIPWFLRRCKCRSYHRRTGNHVEDCPRNRGKK